ncbi:23S rRNA (adenine(2030)-N(6))-methyltransferase RlmJ [Kozakia baliensis]|uniref:23S rRNA (adenine(2030)-N(6))-methyltransferase RlmJ n=1 Tax=Kozakia baliensis TaxID=153496 RepID=UPI00345C47A1
MNYRHAYHAGNFADVMKHALLLALIRHLQRKSTGFYVLDTHAGCGAYDLAGLEANKTQEWRDGIGRLLDDPPEALKDYLTIIRDLGAPGRYPGSPLIVASQLRAQDQLVCCELHPEDVRILRRLFRDNAQVSVHHRDAYAALRALLPPKEQKRGLVLIDPPFEQPDEFARLAQAIVESRRRFTTGMVAAWYPIKHRTPVRAFHNQLRDSGLRALLACEFTLRPPLDPGQLNGCGLLIAAPPYGFEKQAEELLGAMRPALDRDGAAETHVSWLVEE